MIIRIIVDVFLCAALFLCFTGVFRMVISKDIYDKLLSLDIIAGGGGVFVLIAECIWSFANKRTAFALSSVMFIIIIYIFIPVFNRLLCKEMMLENKSHHEGGNKGV